MEAHRLLVPVLSCAVGLHGAAQLRLLCISPRGTGWITWRLYFQLLRDLCTVFRSSCSNLHFQPQCRRALWSSVLLGLSLCPACPYSASFFPIADSCLHMVTNYEDH